MTINRIRILLPFAGVPIIMIVSLLLEASFGGVQVAPPCANSSCSHRPIGDINLFSQQAHVHAAQNYIPKAATVEGVLTKGLDLAEASPVHLVARGTTKSGSVRCNWRGIARTWEQREDAIRFWLALEGDDHIPAAAQVNRLLLQELDRINPIYPETVRANFTALALVARQCETEG